jgi:hypothetical protein
VAVARVRAASGSSRRFRMGRRRRELPVRVRDEGGSVRDWPEEHDTNRVGLMDAGGRTSTLLNEAPEPARIRPGSSLWARADGPSVAVSLLSMVVEGDYVEWPERESNPRHADFQVVAAGRHGAAGGRNSLLGQDFAPSRVACCCPVLSAVRYSLGTVPPARNTRLARSVRRGRFRAAWGNQARRESNTGAHCVATSTPVRTGS